MANTRRLYQIRNRFDSSAAAEKLALLHDVRRHRSRSATELGRLHSALCFIRAFPDSLEHYRLADAVLESFAARAAGLTAAERRKLEDTGIAGTPIHYAFSYEVATWLAKRAPGAVTIDWSASDDPDGLDDILMQLLHAAEDEYFDSGVVSGRDWIRQASANVPGTDFDWLLAQLRHKRLRAVWTQLYNAADLWLRWNLGRSRHAKTRNTCPVARIETRQDGMRRPRRAVKQEIMRPVDKLTRLPRRDGAKLIDVAMASLAVRHRETHHFNHANPDEVYVADAGRGVSIAVFGLCPGQRYPLECTMGYLILSNGTPIGYGGSSIVFRQVNTGINIFDEYRGSEAAFLWVQVMRVYHQLAGCTRYIVNPYQFGAGNTEALKSGAFWFYYRLGYRPVLKDVRQLAAREAARLRRNPAHRSDIRTLKRLASCDMHMVLPGTRARDYFDEAWLTTSSRLASEVLARAGVRHRGQAVARVASQLARDLGIRNLDAWSRPERDAFGRIAPIVAAVRPRGWPSESKRAMRRLLRAKGGDAEARYARLLNDHQIFLHELQKACRSARGRSPRLP